jgi:sugar lactone lactonase YvrE
VDSSGNVYVGDWFNNMIRFITPAGAVTTLAGQWLGGFANGTGTAAKFFGPAGVAVDSSGNLFVADEHNNMIRIVSPGGVVSTLAGSAGVTGSTNATGTAASFSSPGGVALDSSGNVYVADMGNNLIRKITPGGVVMTLAGSGAATFADGTGTAASFNYPEGIAVDSSGNVYVADTSNNMIRKITSVGVVTTLAGSAGVTGATNGPACQALFYAPTAVAVDSSGTVYVTDAGNDLIRKIQ